MRLRALAIVLVASVQILHGQNTAKYPATLPTFEDLLVVVNRANTILTVPISAVDTSIVVSDASKFFSPGANEAGTITIGRSASTEHVKYCSLSGNTFTVCAGGRGFDGSAAIAHVGGEIVADRVVAWTHNQVAAELLAGLSEILRCSVTSELTISGGALPIPSSGCYSVDTEADAASDDLTSFVCATGVRFKLFAADDARTVVIKRGSGAIEMSSDFSLDNLFDTWQGWCRTANIAVNEARNSGGP